MVGCFAEAVGLRSGQPHRTSQLPVSCATAATQVHPVPGRLLCGGRPAGELILLEEVYRPRRRAPRPLEPLGLLEHRRCAV